MFVLYFFPIPRYVPSLRPVNSASRFMAHMNRMARCMLWHIKYIMVFVSGQKLSILLYPQCNIIDVSTVNRSVKIPELCERILCYDNAFHILSYYFACFVSNAVAYLAYCFPAQPADPFSEAPSNHKFRKMFADTYH